MRPVHLYPSFLLFLLSLFTFCACQSHSKWDVEAAQLFRQAAAINHQHMEINARIDSLWTATSTRLSNDIPADFPSVDRDIFIKARNADHMRMFMSFKLLDTTLQSVINRAGQYDQQLAMQLQALSLEQQSFEQQKMNFLRSISEKNPEAGERYASKFRTISASSTY